MSAPPGFGWRKDDADIRDHNARMLLTQNSSPPTYTLDKYLPQARNQKTTSSCVGQATAGALDTRRNAVGAPGRPTSALWVYAIARAVRHQEHEDNGTYIRDVFKATSKLGFAPELAWPFSTGRVNEPPTWKATRAAYDQRWLSGYYRIFGDGTTRIDQLREAISSNYPVIYGFQVDGSWFGYSNGILKGTGEVIGGHATFLYGYDQESFFGFNSWGANWGDGGRYRISLDAIAGERAWDFTVFKTVPKDSMT